MAGPLAGGKRLCLQRQERQAQVLCAGDVSLPFGQHPHGPCAQLRHWRRGGAHQAHAGLQRAAPHGLGRLWPAGGKRGHQTPHPSRPLDLRQHRQHARPAPTPGLFLRLVERSRHLPAGILPLGTDVLSAPAGKRSGLPQEGRAELVPLLPYGTGQRAGH